MTLLVSKEIEDKINFEEESKKSLKELAVESPKENIFESLGIVVYDKKQSYSGIIRSFSYKKDNIKFVQFILDNKQLCLFHKNCKSINKIEITGLGEELIVFIFDSPYKQNYEIKTESISSDIYLISLIFD